MNTIPAVSGVRDAIKYLPNCPAAASSSKAARSPPAAAASRGAAPAPAAPPGPRAGDSVLTSTDVCVKFASWFKYAKQPVRAQHSSRHTLSLLNSDMILQLQLPQATVANSISKADKCDSDHSETSLTKSTRTRVGTYTPGQSSYSKFFAAFQKKIRILVTECPARIFCHTEWMGYLHF